MHGSGEVTSANSNGCEETPLKIWKLVNEEIYVEVRLCNLDLMEWPKIKTKAFNGYGPLKSTVTVLQPEVHVSTSSSTYQRQQQQRDEL